MNRNDKVANVKPPAERASQRGQWLLRDAATAFLARPEPRPVRRRLLGPDADCRECPTPDGPRPRRRTPLDGLFGDR